MRRMGILVLAGLGVGWGCARVEQDAPPLPDLPPAPTIARLEPAPGAVPAAARFLVEFSSVMDESLLVASAGRSETVALATAENVDRAVGAIAHARLTADERGLLVPATARVGSDVRSLQLVPDAPLPAGTYFLLVASRVKDSAGRKLAGNGARFEYNVAAAPVGPLLVAPEPGTLVPLNLARVLVTGSGKVSLVDSRGVVRAGPVEAQGATFLPVAGLEAGARVHLAGEAAEAPGGEFAVAACARTAPVSVQGGGARLTVRDTSVEAEIALDGPAEVEVQVGAPASDPCVGSCAVAKRFVTCAPPPCGPSAWVCPASLRIDGLAPASSHALRVVVRDLQGLESRTVAQRFETVSPVPHVLLSEVMAAPGGVAPKSDGEYVEIVNLGPGLARLDDLGLVGPDGVTRPLLATPPPRPVLLRPAERALLVGSSFDLTRYPGLRDGVPVLRAATHRLLGSGLRDDPPPAFQLVVAGEIPIELSAFPGGGPKCPEGTGLQRDEAAPPDARAAWRCGPPGGTPGLPP